MNEQVTSKFQIKVDPMWSGEWSFGMCLSHKKGETYIYINLFKWTILIGWLAVYD